jgi:hypothetical protein
MYHSNSTLKIAQPLQKEKKIVQKSKELDGQPERTLLLKRGPYKEVHIIESRRRVI